MNEWSEKSIKLARTGNYLDRLYDIYPNDPVLRSIEEPILEDIKKFYLEKNCVALLNKLLDLDKFPFKDSYVSFLRSDRSAINRNPSTTKRICDILFKESFEKIKEGIIEPKEPNRRRGPQFTNWLKGNFTHLKLDKFIENNAGICFLEDSDRKILDFCNQLNVGLSKRPDFIAKSKTKYVIGEAKYLSSLGGNQDRGFDDAIKLASNTQGRRI